MLTRDCTWWGKRNRKRKTDLTQSGSCLSHTHHIESVNSCSLLLGVAEVCPEQKRGGTFAALHTPQLTAVLCKWIYIGRCNSAWDVVDSTGSGIPTYAHPQRWWNGILLTYHTGGRGRGGGGGEGGGEKIICNGSRGFSKGQLKGKQLLLTFRPDAL